MFGVPSDPWLEHAVRVIRSTYGVKVSVHSKDKDLLKFGRNDLVGTSEATIMTLPAGVLHETYVSDNLITHISSADAADTEEVKIEGHTVDGSGNLTFVVQSKTLAGQTKTALDTPLARITQIYNNGSTDLVGPVYGYEDDTVVAGVPQTNAKIHIIVPAGRNNSLKCSTALSQYDYWIVTGWFCDCLDKTSAVAEVSLEVRLNGKVFRQLETGSVQNGGSDHHDFKPYHIIPANSDVRLVAIADGANTQVAGGIHGVLAIQSDQANMTVHT